MAETTKFTGNDLYVSFQGTELTGSDGVIQSVEWTEENTLIDVTGAGQEAQRQLKNKRNLTGSINWWEKAGGSPAGTLLTAGAFGTLEVGPRGTASGREKYEMEVYVNSVEEPYRHNEAVAGVARFTRHGDWISNHKRDGDTY